MLIPGNHDNYARDSLAAMYRHWGRYLPAGGGPAADYTAGYPVVRETQEVRLLGVNTSCVTRVFSATGELGKDQRQRLARTLVREPGDERFQCLLIHHPPLPGMTEPRKALRDSEQLEGIINQNLVICTVTVNTLLAIPVFFVRPLLRASTMPLSGFSTWKKGLQAGIAGCDW